MSRGGYREGAGRPLGSSNKCSTQQSQRLSELARAHTDEALLTLVDVARNGRTDAARVSAANALLDRAYGKPAVIQENEVIDLPPLIIQRAEPS
ncbi:MAG: hypothetical protein VW879_13955 [Opitutae bacterium]